jgi:ABC-type antimicrobial peptide transport system permease subunit
MRLRLVLVVIQMSACCVLATLTAFSFDSLRSILESKTGGRLRNAMLITAQAAPYAETSYFKAIEQATRATGAMPLTWTARLPGGQPTWQSFRIEPPRLPSRDIVLDTSWVTAESVPRLAQIPLAGRLFGFRERGCRVAVVNESAAAQLFPNNTVGRVVRDPTGLAVEIIGIVEDKGGSLRQPTIYYDATNQSASPHTQDIASGFRAPVQSQLLSADLDVNVISPNYFQTMKSSLVAGEGFSNGPIPGMCRVAIVNEEAANLYFGGRTGVGAAVIDVRGVRTSIIGIVHSQSFGMFQRRPQPAIYFPIAQDCPLRMTLIAAPKNRKQSFDTDLRSTVESVPGRNPAFPVVIEQVSSHLARTALAPLRITTVVFGASAVIGILLSILGLFGVLSDVARHRRRELAIRTALGAQPWRIVFHLLRDGGRLACAGTLAGMLAALVLLRLLVRITPGSYSPSPLTWLVAPLVLAGIVSLAGLLPAYRAIGVSPHSVLHDS